MLDILVKKDEFREWLAEEPQVILPLLEGYKAAISDMGSNLLLDPRSTGNDHIINPEFSTEPRYFMGYQANRERQEFIISCLYVFPALRGRGHAKRLIDIAKKVVNTGGFIQVAVEESKINELDGFYKKHGFISTNDIIPNALGVAYRDYFWSGRTITLSREKNVINVTFQ